MKAFTIVELIVVIMVIGILATVTVIGYNGYQRSAKVAQAKTILGDTYKKIEEYKRAQGMYPMNLQYIEVETQAGISVSYDSFGENNWFCLSTAVDASSSVFYSTSTNSTIYDGDCDNINVIAGEPAGFVDDPQNTAKVVNLNYNLSGHPDIIMYTVFDVFDTDSSYSAIARLHPDNAAGGNKFQIDTTTTGSSGLRYRIDTSAQSNAASTQNSARTPGRHIGWLSVRNGLTVREFAYDKAVAHTSLSLAPGDGWHFTQIYLNASGTSQKGIAAVVYNAAHNETTRELIMGWLAHKYNVWY